MLPTISSDTNQQDPLTRRIENPFLGSRWLETGALGRLLGTYEASPFDRFSRMANLPLRKIRRILANLTEATKGYLPAPSAANQKDFKDIRKLIDWMNAAATRFEKRVPKVPLHQAIWLCEYDGSDGVTLPIETQRCFDEMQRKHLVPANSRESVFVIPESTAWLRKAIDKHDGFLLTINEGDPQNPLIRSEPRALFVATCNQANPSPILPKLRECGREFFEKLPQTRSGRVPMVVGELVVMTQEGSHLVRDYGEAPLEMLIHQAEFNVISRFAECERVDSVSICRSDSVALKAYKRYGYIDTGTTYIDQYKTVFTIVYKPLFPADVILGYRDIDE